MKKSFVHKRIIAMALLAAMLGTVSCGSAADSTESDSNITLTEPVGVVENYDFVALRDIYQADVYSCMVSPVVTEYSFDTDQTFKKFGVAPGKTVSAGEALVYSDTHDLDNQIADKKEEIEDFEIEHAYEVDELNKDIADAKKNEYEASVPVFDMYQNEPDENTNKGAYDAWASVLMMPDSRYKRAIQNRMRLEQSLVQNTELYEVEHDYKLVCLDRLEEKIDDATIICESDGEVVACNYYSDGDFIKKDTPILAVGDTTTRILETEYISKSTISKALDYYAIIDGKRVEIEYQNMEPEEYAQIKDQGEDPHTTFYINDIDGIEIGQYAAVVVLKDARTQVPCVPVDALKKENDSYYVYLFDGEESVYTPVEIGMRDGYFAEVLSGVSVGDKVLSAQAPKKGTKTATVVRDDYSMTTEIGGFLYYPFSEWITNPVKNGQSYIKEICVSNYENVSAGQVLAKVEVIPDQIEIDRLKRQIDRTNTRLAKLKKEKYDLDARNITDRGVEKSIVSKEKDLARAKRQLDKLSEYTGVIDIKAPYDGIVLDAEALKEGDLIYPNTKIIEFASDSLSYIILKDDKHQITYGNEAVIKYNDGTGQKTIDSKVVTIASGFLSADLKNDYALVEIPDEYADELSGSTLGATGRWDRSNYKLTVTTRQMKDVLMIPKASVVMKDRYTYVNVLQDDGSVVMKSFIAGGSDNSYYWVAEGLTEGMTICWE